MRSGRVRDGLILLWFAWVWLLWPGWHVVLAAGAVGFLAWLLWFIIGTLRGGPAGRA